MDNNIVRIMGILADEVYKNHSVSKPIVSLPQYTVIETQDSLLGPIVNLTGFQAMIVQDNSIGD